MVRKLGWVEGLRGIAALMVAAAHFLQMFLPAVYEGDAAKSWGIGERAFETSPVNVVLNPSFAVCFFFVLSGYVLSRAFLADGDPARIWRGAAKRFPRLMLPVLASVLLAWAVLMVGGFHYGEIRPLAGAVMPDYFAVRRSVWYALGEGSFGAFFAGDNSLNPVLWTIGVELYGSFLVFALLAVCRRRWWRWLGYGAAMAVLYDGYYLAFPLGVALAALPPGAGRPRLAAALALAALALGGYPYYGAEVGYWCWLPTPGAALPIVFYHIVGAALLVQAMIWSPLRDHLDGRACRFLGRISYGLYLVHFTVLAALSTWLVLLLAPRLGYLPAIAVAFAASLPVMLLAGWVFARAIDEPATRLADQFARFVLRLAAAIPLPHRLHAGPVVPPLPLEPS